MRKITSIILALAFIIVAVTGVQLDLAHVTEHGGGKPPVVQSADGHSIGDSGARIPENRASFNSKAVHEWAGYLFIVAGFLHLMFNFKRMKTYFKISR